MKSNKAAIVAWVLHVMFGLVALLLAFLMIFYIYNACDVPWPKARLGERLCAIPFVFLVWWIGNIVWIKVVKRMISKGELLELGDKYLRIPTLKWTINKFY